MATAARGLGKGLSALMKDDFSEALSAQGAEKMPQTLPLEVLQAGKYQPRRFRIN